MTLPNDPIPDDLMKPSKAARLLGVHVNSLLRWIARGRLRAWHVGARGYRVSRADVLAQLRPVEPPEAPRADAAPTPRQRKAYRQWVLETAKKHGIL